MRLYLFRHGIAEEYSDEGSDAARRLTEEGQQRTAKAAQGLTRIMDQPDAILTSPKARAFETARILADRYDIDPEVVDVLSEGSPAQVVRMLQQRREGVVVIVGHEPTFSRVTEMLCGGTEAGDFIQMKKAGCACLDVDFTLNPRFGFGRLLWLATPKMLRGLA